MINKKQGSESELIALRWLEQMGQWWYYFCDEEELSEKWTERDGFECPLGHVWFRKLLGSHREESGRH